jgi:serine protease Do
LNIRWYGPSLILLLTVVTVMLLGPRLTRQIVWNQTDARITQVRQDLTGDAHLSQLSASFSKVSEAVEPSVVHVQTFGTTARSGGLFSRYDPPQRLGNGSGWVYRHPPRDGGEPRNYILTNHHVVAGAALIRVRFADGSEHTAELVNSDQPTDVAVLRVDDAYLHPAAISDEPVAKGQIVFAFGSPFRFDFSVSQGIVSASGRQLDFSDPGKYEDFIQTDAAINPGNSGGPLTDIYGRVVGMNTAIASSRRSPDDPGGFMGLGFAIPVQMAVDVATRILDDGQFDRGYLGVYIADLTPELAESFGHRGTRGVLVEHPVGDGPADLAGLRPGDIVTHVQDEPVLNVDDLRYRVAGFAPGSELQVTALRDGRRTKFRVTLTQLPPANSASRLRPRSTFVPQSTAQIDALRALGIERVADFDRSHAAQQGQDAIEGVMIIDLRPGSVAAGQRLAPTAIITHVGDTRVRNTAELRAALDDLNPWEPLRLTAVYWDYNLAEYVTRFALLDVTLD